MSKDKTSSINYGPDVSDLWLVKLDNDGNEIWQKSLITASSNIYELENGSLACLANESFINENVGSFSINSIPRYIYKFNEFAEFESEITVGEFKQTYYGSLIETNDKSFLLGGSKIVNDLTDPNNLTSKANINVIKIFDDVDIENIDNNLNVYPNPFSDAINIDYDKGLTVKMYNSIGSKIIETNSKNFTIENLSQGLYMLHIYNVKGDLISINKVLKRL